MWGGTKVGNGTAWKWIVFYEIAVIVHIEISIEMHSSFIRLQKAFLLCENAV